MSDDFITHHEDVVAVTYPESDDLEGEYTFFGQEPSDTPKIYFEFSNPRSFERGYLHDVNDPEVYRENLEDLWEAVEEGRQEEIELTDGLGALRIGGGGTQAYHGQKEHFGDLLSVDLEGVPGAYFGRRSGFFNLNEDNISIYKKGGHLRDVTAENYAGSLTLNKAEHDVEGPLVTEKIDQVFQFLEQEYDIHTNYSNLGIDIDGVEEPSNGEDILIAFSERGPKAPEPALAADVSAGVPETGYEPLVRLLSDMMQENVMAKRIEEEMRVAVPKPSNTKMMADISEQSIKQQLDTVRDEGEETFPEHITFHEYPVELMSDPEYLFRVESATGHYTWPTNAVGAEPENGSIEQIVVASASTEDVRDALN